MKTRIRRLIASPAMIPIAAALAVLLLLPTLGSGLMMDDYIHRESFSHGTFRLGSAHGDWDMFRFQDGDRAGLQRGMDYGNWPWWTAPGFRMAFLRPLTSLTHAFDYHHFPDLPAVMHAENIALYAVVAVLAGLLYRRFLGLTVAFGLATLMFALDDAHGTTVTWIANRNAVIAAAFGFGAILLHDRGVRDRDRRARILAPIVLAVGVLAGEAALGTLGYLVAHAIWIEEGPAKKRAASFLPYAIVAVAWAVVYRALGYGTHGGGFYIDPGREPVAFIKAVMTRLPLLLHSQFGFPPADMWMLIPDANKSVALAVVVGGVVIGALVLFAGVRRTRENAFFATGMLIALGPVCATWPSDRLLLFAGFGAFGLIGDFLTAPRDHLGGVRKLAVRVVAFSFIALHLILTLIFFPVRATQVGSVLHDPIERGARSLPPGLDGKTLVVVNGPDCLTPAYSVIVHASQGGGSPAAVRQLTIATRGTITLRRTSDRALELTLSEGYFRDPFSQVFRGESHPMGLGEEVHVAGMTATVKELAPDGLRPKTVSFAFDEPLSSPSFAWIIWQGQGFVRFSLPAVGEAIEMPSIDYGKFVSGS